MRIRSAQLLLLALILGVQPAWGLTDEEVFRDLRFNLTNPGARSLALGGAFISLADDATAAQANPAGLGFLRTSEFFAELRAVDNAAQSAVRNESLPAGIDTFVATGTDLDDVVCATCRSAVILFDRWTLGVSRQELLNIRNDTLNNFAFTFSGSPGAVLAEGVGTIDLEVTNINVSAGFRISEKLGVGATITYSTLDAKSEVVNEIVDTAGNLAGMAILEPTLDLRTSIDDSDDEVVFSLGLIYKRLDKPKNNWSVGAVYRQAPSFSVSEDIDAAGLDIFEVRKRLGTRFANRFSLPDVFGVGGSIRFTDRLTLSLDIERILYSNLLDDYVAGVNALTSEDAEFTVDDATDFRLGGEYVLFNENNFLPVMALRAGVFTEEPSTIRARSTGSTSFATEEVFGGGDREFHGAVGVGFPIDAFTVDVGADFSDTDNEYLVSVIYKRKGRRP